MIRREQFVHFQQFQTATGVIRPDNACKQFVVNNPTAFVVKLGFNNVETDGYEFIVKAQSLFVSPVVNFDEIKFFITGYVDGSRVLPTCYCYDRYIGTPMVSALT